VGIVAKIFVGLNYRSIQQAMEHKELLNNETIGVKWVKFNRKQQNDAMNENVKQIVVRWWTKETRVSPNVKDVVCHFVSPNIWEKHAIHFLQENQVHSKFMLLSHIAQSNVKVY